MFFSWRFLQLWHINKLNFTNLQNKSWNDAELLISCFDVQQWIEVVNRMWNTEQEICDCQVQNHPLTCRNNETNAKFERVEKLCDVCLVTLVLLCPFQSNQFLETKIWCYDLWKDWQLTNFPSVKVFLCAEPEIYHCTDAYDYAGDYRNKSRNVEQFETHTVGVKSGKDSCCRQVVSFTVQPIWCCHFLTPDTAVSKKEMLASDQQDVYPFC